MKREFTLTGKDGKKLYACVYEAEQPKGVLCVSHGLGEHGGRYEDCIRVWNENGFTVYIHDQRGHGKSIGSPKEKGIARIPDLESDLLTLIDVAKRETGLPVFLFGHSLGGLIGLYTLLHGQPEIKGAIITSPWLVLKRKLPGFLPGMLQGLGKLLPNAALDNGLAADNLCHDEKVCREYLIDPNNHGKIGLVLFGEASEAAKWVLDNAKMLSVPLLLCHGDSDPICDVEGSRAFAKNAGVSVREFPGSYHEIHNEPEHRETLWKEEIAFMEGLL